MRNVTGLGRRHHPSQKKGIAVAFRRIFTGLLLSTALAAPAVAQEAASEATGPLSPEEAAAEVEFLKAQIEAMQAQLDAVKKATSTAIPSYKAAPEFKDGDWKFKVRGRMMYDVGYIENPDDAIPGKNLGFNSRIRRARLGVEGAMPGGFSYKAEADFADNSVSWADLFVEYKPSTSPFSVRVGHFETFQSLEQITSSRHIMFLERAQMNEAFNHGRRLGGAIGVDTGDFLFRAGIFNDTINSSFDNDDWLFGTRLVWAPKFGDVQTHFGVNYQHREYQSNALNFRYRMRNIARLSDVRLVDTSQIAAESDDVLGLEAAAIFGSFHAVGEIQWAKPDTIAPGSPFTGGDSAGSGTNFVAEDPDFVSYYIEGGWWITGETRGYKKGEWDRTKVKNGFDKGGIGAFALTARYDHLDLADSALYSGGVGTSTSRGGEQDIYALSLVWQPIDYVRITTQYAYTDVTGGPFASAVVTNAESSKPVNERSYSQDSFAVRFAFDF